MYLTQLFRTLLTLPVRDLLFVISHSEISEQSTRPALLVLPALISE